MKKKKNWKPRLPREAIETLRHRGGAHGSPKGRRGYSRQREKSAWRKQMDNSVCFFYFLNDLFQRNLENKSD